MILTLIIAVVTCLIMFVAILLKPTVCIGIKSSDKKISVGTYWIVALLGALVLLAVGSIGFGEVFSGLTANNAINPIKILTLFISNTALSVFLDEAGFFRYLATKSLTKVRGSQKRFFVTLYLLVSVLTVFTSNDIVILTFTPFICYYAKNAQVDCVPYLVGEFVAANSLSLTLIIGNPTNIYLATSYGVDFGRYFIVMLFPALFAGITGFVVVYLIFRKKLSAPIAGVAEKAEINDKPSLIVGLCCLALCTVLLAVSSYLNFEMWYISLAFAVGLLIFSIVYSLCKRQKPLMAGRTLARCPWELIPFVISMFVMVLALNKCGITEILGKGLDAGKYSILSYGFTSFLFANLINNIPMSVLFGSVVSYASNPHCALFAAVIGSNIGAYLTPVGALAGIMWLNILKSHGVKFGFLQFIKYGVFTAVPTMAASLAGLYLSAAVFGL